MGWKPGRSLGLFLVGIVSLGLRATGQESMYSADSLTATFEKASRVSLRGAQITFRDVVVESDNEKLTFKNSHNSRVICRLTTSTDNRNKPPSVGSQITVVGTVRGRGLLGNVTLDNCSKALIRDSRDEVPNPHQDIGSAPADAPLTDAPSEENSDAVSLPVHPEEVRNDSTPSRNVLPPKPAAPKTRQQAAPSRQPDRQNTATVNSSDSFDESSDSSIKGSDSSRDVPYRFYVLLVLSGAVGYSILSRLLRSTARTMRSSTPPSSANAEEVRKAALEALRLKSEKKK